MRRREFVGLIGGAAAWPLAARAQQAIPVIGSLSSGSPESDLGRLTAFQDGLEESGYIEGRNFILEYRWARGQYHLLPSLADELANLPANIIVAIGGTTPALAAGRATKSIPVLINVGGSPVDLGLVSSLRRPGGNVTGVAMLAVDLAAKRLQLLHEIVPTTAVLAVLINSVNPGNKTEANEMLDAARSLRLQVHVLQASTAAEIDKAFQRLAEVEAKALLVAVDALLLSRREQIVKLAAQHALPGVYGWREFTTAGGLMSYGPNIADGYRPLGVYAAKIA
jgi:putative ABC transport system substrate-binding protein